MENKVVNLDSFLTNSSTMQELEVKESREIDGGVVPLAAVGFLTIAKYTGAAAVIGGAGYAVGSWIGRNF
jgi:hypothetical protein